MSFPEFARCQPAINNYDLDEAEATMGIILPFDLRQHYLEYNGGSPYPCTYAFDDDFYEVNMFFPIKYGISSVEKTYNDTKNAVPPGLLPIAYDSGGNLYCYSLVKPTIHSICYWDHEFYNDADHGVTVLAPSLQVFLEALAPGPDEDEDEDEEYDDDEEYENDNEADAD